MKVPAVNSVTLQKLYYAVQDSISARELASLRNADISCVYEGRLKAMVLTLRAEMLGNVKTDVVKKSVDVPLDWWQALRQRWFPHWWLKRWPVKKRKIEWTETTTVTRCCPHLQTAADIAHIDFLVRGQSMWDYMGNDDGRQD